MDSAEYYRMFTNRLPQYNQRSGWPDAASQYLQKTAKEGDFVSSANTKNRSQRESSLLTAGNFRKKIIFFMIPIFIGNLFQQLYNTADSFIVGNLLGPNALAAVSSTGSLIYLVIGFFMGFSMGAGVVIARRIGAGDALRTARAVHTTVSIGLIFSVITSVLSVLMVDQMLRWMGTPEEVFSLASAYLRIYFGGSFALIMYNFFVGILEAAGDSRHPLYYLIFSSILNVFLDYLFVAGFGMGVGGAAIATVISELCSALLAYRQLRRTSSSVHIDLRQLCVNREDLQEIIRYGLPTALQGCVIDLSNILIQAYINSFGSLAMAGIGAYSKIEGFSFLPVTAFSIAMSTFVSQNLGAKQYDRVKAGIRFGEICAVLMTEAIGMLIFTFAPQLIGMFVKDATAIQFGVGRAHVCALFACLMGFSHVTSAIMRGIGKPMAPMIVMLVCWCAVRVAVLMTIGRVYQNINLAYWIYPFTWTLSTLAYVFYARWLKRKPEFSYL